MKQKQSRKHHFVPQFYLRRFAHEGRLTAVEIKSGRILEGQGTGAVAFETDANRPDGVLLDRGFDVEGELASLESRLANALRDFPNRFPPAGDTRDAISDFILLQIVRDPRKLRQHEDLEEEVGSLKNLQLMALGVLMNNPDDPVRRRGLQESGLLEFREEVRADVSERCWHLYEAPAGGMAEFITSDSPVYLVDGKQRGLVQHADVHQMFLPLDRHHLLILERGSPEDDRKFAASDQQVLELNRMTAHAARRFAYAHPAINRGWLKSSVYPVAAVTGGHVQRP